MDCKRKASSARIPAPRNSSARFIAPTLLQRTDSLPDSPQWLYVLKLDGYRAIANKRDGIVHLRSRNDNDFSQGLSGRGGRDSRRCPVRYTSSLDAALPVLVQSVEEQGVEGLIATLRNSVYAPGLRTGAWMKMRVSRGQELVIGGDTRGTRRSMC